MKTTKQYCGYIHTHVTVKHPTAKWGEGWDGPMRIVLVTKDRVWVPASYAHERTPEVLQVGDGTDNGYDINGDCVLSVPAEWCCFWTQEEAQQIEMMIDADGRLLFYAR